MKRILVILFLMIYSSFADDLTHLDELEKGKVVVGEALKAKDLKGKVILFKYWGYN